MDMSNASARPVRRSVRLKDYDYARAGAYFVTLCTHHRACVFAAMDGEEVQLSRAGRVVAYCWEPIPAHFAITLDEWVVMPNHLHGIIVMADDIPGAGVRATLGLIVGTFKSAAARRLNELRRTQGSPVWQRSFHEHVIRNEADLGRIRRYIVENPVRWAHDPENPDRA